MCNGSGHFPSSDGWKSVEQGEGEFATNCAEGVSVVEQEGGAAMERAEKVENFEEGQWGVLGCLPVLRARAVSF
jgi:hypothetical protein